MFVFFPGGFGFRHVWASGLRGVLETCCFKCLVSEVGFGFCPGSADWKGWRQCASLDVPMRSSAAARQVLYPNNRSIVRYEPNGPNCQSSLTGVIEGDCTRYSFKGALSRMTKYYAGLRFSKPDTG